MRRQDFSRYWIREYFITLFQEKSWGCYAETNLFDVPIGAVR
jgi:hypothetical protein